MSTPRRSSVTVEDFEPSAGAFWESTGLRNMLAWEGVTVPGSRRPLSEAMCFGLEGGIAAGCVTAPAGMGRNGGSGFGIVGRRGALDPGAARFVAALRGIGGRATVRETGGARTGRVHLERALASGRPAFVWCAPPAMLGSPWPNVFGNCVLLVYGIDARRNVALIGDRSRRAIAIPLRELERLRRRVRAHRQRVATCEPPARLGPLRLRAAVLGAIRACATDILKPKIRSAGLPGLLDWARVIVDPGHRRGWLRVHPGGRVYAALRDVYDSIETAGTGGGLFRPLFASFLKEAATAARRKALQRSARQYRSLGTQWSALARTALPLRIPAFRATRRLLAQRRRLITAGGPGLAAHAADVRAGLDAIEARMRRRFPLDHIELMALLTSMREQILDLHGAEERAARQLLDAAKSRA